MSARNNGKGAKVSKAMSDEHDFSLPRDMTGRWCSKCGCFKIRVERRPVCSVQQQINSTHRWRRDNWQDEIWWVCSKCGIFGGEDNLLGVPPKSEKTCEQVIMEKALK
jgi:RNase P subunit RPR2